MNCIPFDNTVSEKNARRQAILRFWRCHFLRTVDRTNCVVVVIIPSGAIRASPKHPILLSIISMMAWRSSGSTNDEMINKLRRKFLDSSRVAH